MIPYAGSALQSEKKYTWQVRVWDNYGQSSSDGVNLLHFQNGVSDINQTGKQNGLKQVLRKMSLTGRLNYFRKQFSASKKIKSATAIHYCTWYV